MKIAIISDTHDHLQSINKVLQYLKKNKIFTVIHCGDVTSKDTWRFLLKNFSGQIYLCNGNADNNINLKIKIQKSNIFEHFGEITIDNKKIIFTHKLEKPANLLAKKPNIIFYGHTHKPWIEKKKFKNKQIIMANPGNLAGIYYTPTFAIYDTKNNKLQLKILNNIK